MVNGSHERLELEQDMPSVTLKSLVVDSNSNIIHCAEILAQFFEGRDRDELERNLLSRENNAQ